MFLRHGKKSGKNYRKAGKIGEFCERKKWKKTFTLILNFSIQYLFYHYVVLLDLLHRLTGIPDEDNIALLITFYSGMFISTHNGSGSILPDFVDKLM